MSSVIESAASGYYIGLMSGTSMDGVDAVLAGFSGATPQALAHAACPYPATLRTALLALQTPGHDEITRSQLLALELAQLYAEAVEAVLRKAGLAAGQIAAVGCHGQTVRHAPHAGYTVQLNAPAPARPSPASSMAPSTASPIPASPASPTPAATATGPATRSPPPTGTPLAASPGTTRLPLSPSPTSGRA